MSISPERISENWNTHLKIIDRFIQSPRKEKVLEFFKKLEERLALAPASGKAHFHNAFPGGYVDHVNRVVQYALKTKAMWEELGLDIDFTDEELVFSALCHDLGKVGDEAIECYVPQTDEWRQRKLNETYTINTDLPFMLIQDRSLFLLQQAGISISHNEYMAIKLHDGLYDDSNKPYFISTNPDSKLRTNIVSILHQADFMASRLEYETWKKESKGVKASSKKPKQVAPSSSNLLNLVKSL